jgi:hypothetical protein
MSMSMETTCLTGNRPTEPALEQTPTQMAILTGQIFLLGSGNSQDLDC